MNTVIVPSFGFNYMESYFGIFTSLEKAHQAFLDAGCKKVKGRSYREPEKEFIVTTPAFRVFLEARGLPFYSTSCDPADEEIIHFREVLLDTIVRGYDDD